MRGVLHVRGKKGYNGLSLETDDAVTMGRRLVSVLVLNPL